MCLCVNVCVGSIYLTSLISKTICVCVQVFTNMPCLSMCVCLCKCAIVVCVCVCEGISEPNYLECPVDLSVKNEKQQERNQAFKHK